MKTLYEILGVNQQATDTQIRAAWKKLVKICHPDMGSAANREQFDAVQQAYEILSDPDRKARYDETGVVEVIMPDQQYQRSIAIIAGAMQYAIGNNGDSLTLVDLVARMREAIEESRLTLLKNQEIGEEFIIKMERLIGRFKVRGGPNILEDMVRANKTQAEKNREKFPKMLEDLRLALEILKNYTFDSDKMIENFNFVRTAHGTMSPGGYQVFFTDPGDPNRW